MRTAPFYSLFSINDWLEKDEGKEASASATSLDLRTSGHVRGLKTDFKTMPIWQ